MQLDFLNVLFTVIFLVVLVLPGYILAKADIFKEYADSVLSALVLFVAQPMLIITSFQKQPYSKEIARNMLICAGLTALVHIVMIAFVFLVIRGNDAKRNILRGASVFANCGYMGIPFLQLLFGNSNPEVLIYAAVIISIFNIFDWSFGIFMVSGNKKTINIFNILLNPTIISIIIGFILFITVRTPLVDIAEEGSTLDLVLTKFMNSINYLSEMVTPLAMMVIGVKLSKMKLKDIVLNKVAYIASFNKLIIMSLVSILIVAFLPISEVLKYTIFFTMSMPCATSNVLFAVRFGGDAETASVSILLSTLLSIVTIPLMFLVFQALV